MRRRTFVRLFIILATVLCSAALSAQQVRITVHIFTSTSTNHGQLLSLWQDHSGLTTSIVQEQKGLVLHKGTKSSDLGIPYANVEGFDGTPLRELGFDVRSQKNRRFSGEHCNASPTIEVTLTNGTTYAFYCTSGGHVPISSTAWDRVRFTDADATPISCRPKGCTMKPWPGFATGQAIVASPADLDPKSSTFQIIMMDGYDSAPDFSGATYMDNIDLNGTLIGDSGIHAVKCRIRGCTQQSPNIEARGGSHAEK
jgi:hypothetical protein